MIKRALLFIFAALLVFFALLLFFSFVNRDGISIPILSTPTPTPTPLPLEEFVASPSAYATDEVVLKIEKELGIFERNLDTVDLDEFPLRPPVLDLNVEY